MMDMNSPGFGQYCVDHSNRYGNQLIDKLVISYTTDMVLPTREKPCFKGAFQEFQFGNTLQLQIGGERIIPTKPLYIAVYEAFSLLMGRYFTKSVKQSLLPFFQSQFSFEMAPRFIQTLESMGFWLSQLELAFDLDSNALQIPYSIPAMNKVKGTTFYTKDRRWSEREHAEGYSGPVKHDRIDSIVCLYDRTKKLELGLGGYRLEFRIKQHRKDLLEMTDLALNMQQFVERKGSRIKAIVSKYVPANTIPLNSDYVYQKYPLLPKLITVGQDKKDRPALTN